MATKQMHDDNKPVVHSVNALRILLSSATTSYESAEVALLHIMRAYDFDPGLLQKVLTGLSILF